MQKFLVLKNLPGLPELFVQEALADGYHYTDKPYTFSKPSRLFESTLFYKLLTDNFGAVWAGYMQNPPHSVYDWHLDNIRKWALNWVVKTNPKAGTFYRANQRHKNFWDLEEVTYSHDCPTLLDVQQEHSVINNHDDNRIIMSVSVKGIDNIGFQQAHDFLSKLEYTQQQLFGYPSQI